MKNEILRAEACPTNCKASLETDVLEFSATNGTGNLVPFKGMVNWTKYIEILRRKIVSFMQTFDGAFSICVIPCG